MCTVQKYKYEMLISAFPSQGIYGRQNINSKNLKNEKINRNEEQFFFIGKQKII